MQYDQEYTDYQLQRNRLRKFIRRSYMNHTAKFVLGKAIDFGCGIGDLLRILPSGSIGLEVNEATVRHCRQIGLDVHIYNVAHDNYQLKFLEPGRFSTFIVSHVLEHLDDSDQVLRTMASSCLRLGIERIIVVVPGTKGFAYDRTHRTFIDKKYLHKHNLLSFGGYTVTLMKHFPFNAAWVGRLFTHNELLIVYDRNQKPAQNA